VLAWFICLERGADLHMAQLMPLPLTVSCFSKIQIGFAFLVPAHRGSPGQRAVKRVCVCVCVFGPSNYSASGRGGLSAFLCLYIRKCVVDLHEIFVHVTYGSGSVLLWRRYVLSLLWMPSYLHIMNHMGARGYRYSEWRHCVVVRRAGFKCVEALGRIIIRGPTHPQML